MLKDDIIGLLKVPVLCLKKPEQISLVRLQVELGQGFEVVFTYPVFELLKDFLLFLSKRRNSPNEPLMIPIRQPDEPITVTGLKFLHLVGYIRVLIFYRRLFALTYARALSYLLSLNWLPFWRWWHPFHPLFRTVLQPELICIRNFRVLIPHIYVVYFGIKY